MLCDLCMNMNLCHFSSQELLFFLLWPDCSFSQTPVVSGKPSWPATVTSCIKATCAEEVAHIKRCRGLTKWNCVLFPDGRSPLNPPPALICVTKLQLANIRTIGKIESGYVPLLPSLSSQAFLIHRRIVLGEFIPVYQLLLLLINLNHPHDDEGNSQMRANIGRLHFMLKTFVDVWKDG